MGTPGVKVNLQRIDNKAENRSRLGTGPNAEENSKMKKTRNKRRGTQYFRKQKKVNT